MEIRYIKNIVKTGPRIVENLGYGDKVVTFNTMSLPVITKIYNTTHKNMKPQ